MTKSILNKSNKKVFKNTHISNNTKQNSQSSNSNCSSSFNSSYVKKEMIEIRKKLVEKLKKINKNGKENILNYSPKNKKDKKITQIELQDQITKKLTKQIDFYSKHLNYLYNKNKDIKETLPTLELKLYKDLMRGTDKIKGENENKTLKIFKNKKFNDASKFVTYNLLISSIGYLYELDKFICELKIKDKLRNMLRTFINKIKFDIIKLASYIYLQNKTMLYYLKNVDLSEILEMYIYNRNRFLGLYREGFMNEFKIIKLKNILEQLREKRKSYDVKYKENRR